MAQDLIYTFDKTSFLRSAFGEIQNDFNMSFTIDGTKDSAKVRVLSFNENEILPYTIVYHRNTQSWWVATHDKVERYVNENGFIYVHNLQLEGAIELLNARDLTDCGFNSNTYTIQDFLIRLFKLSNFEFKEQITLDLDENILNKKVEYVKTFENYTLLSAIREFLDGYNLCAKLSFNVTTIGIENPRYFIIGATIRILQRTGDFNLATHDIDTFDDVRESKVINKDNYGTCVVSNAENVVSSVSKTYPSLGTIRPSGTEYRILAQNGIIRLPSNVFKANWLKLCLSIPNLEVNIKIGNYEGVIYNGEVIGQFRLNPYNMQTFTSSFEYMERIVSSVATQQGMPSFYTNYINARIHKESEIIDFCKKAATMTLYDGNQLNPVNGAIVKGENVPYIPNVTYNAKWLGTPPEHPTLPLIFCDKETHDMLERPWQAIYWERGKNEIKGFNGFETETGGIGEITGFDPNNCDLQGQTTYVIYDDGNGNYVSIGHSGGSTIHFRDTQWIVNYIPMSDIKLKVDNDRESNDIQLYNQNGKLTDSVALSKVLNSYSKEISSDTITRYKTYYDFSDIPQVGSVVTKGNQNYVINNISYDFFHNENDGYYIECEFTLSKYISLKSMMVNPNTNIRDYGIPQNYNVKRKQLYRDYYELDFTPNGDINYYLNPSNIFRFYSNDPEEYTAVMRLHYVRPINNSYYYYYQLDTVNYYMDKLLIIVCDFNDNNIIGYTNQNVWSGFDITRIFQHQIDSLNTPISYTDSKGEVEDFDICFETNEQLTEIYYNYQLSQTGGDTYTGTLYNYSPFIPKEIYDGAYENHSIRILENGYDKDALEVPVFEYCCQIGDNDQVLIGDNILMKHQNTIIMYSFYTDNDLTQYNATTPRRIVRNGDILTLTNSANIIFQSALPSPSLDYNNLSISLFDQEQYNIEENTYNYGTRLNIPSYGVDIAIFKHSYNIETNEEIVELMFIAKKVTIDKLISQNILILAINHYELK